MTSMTIQVENPSILASLRKILNSIDGVTIVKTGRKKSSTKTKEITETAGFREAMEDIKCGRVSGPFNTTDDLFNHLGI